MNDGERSLHSFVNPHLLLSDLYLKTIKGEFVKNMLKSEDDFIT